MQKETEDRLRATIIKPTREAFKVEMDMGEINAGFIFGVIAFLSGVGLIVAVF